MSTIYVSELGVSELINLKVEDIDSSCNAVIIKGGKVRKIDLLSAIQGAIRIVQEVL